ncbi:hypothetical protein FN976_16225 [Caenimonas sedimenti]|uniref:BcpO-related WXXGXW repeat protein n=1 Tax=Caenimonas sedimenti TaxID=2596921 RepID=A0A562ZNK7_9BURK|nr:YXWGXW repeat-containing protein [Caenimonas sedimenti]TWO69898.1 hypothetical protein FN976_16225 [Caenimonas sedimenti]
MKHNSLIAPLVAASALMGLAGAAQAVPAVVATPSYGPTVVVRQAPPPPIFEAAPGVREGYVWAPGHYEWRNGRYEWRPGYWVSERPGYIWEQARWIQRPDGSWYLAGNTWERRGPNGDRDGDGIANRYDRDRDGDGIPNRYDRGRDGPYGDRDGDGVSNRDDDYPNNPNRS